MTKAKKVKMYTVCKGNALVHVAVRIWWGTSAGSPAEKKVLEILRMLSRDKRLPAICRRWAVAAERDAEVEEQKGARR